MLLFTEKKNEQKVCQYQLRAEQWSQKEDHLHVDDSFSLDPFVLPFSVSSQLPWQRACHLFLCIRHRLLVLCCFWLLFFTRPLFRRMNLHVDEFVLSVFTPLCPSLSPWFYLFCLSSRLLWPLICRFILHLICLSLLSRLVPLCSPVMVISVRWGLTSERSDVEASYWTRETETDRKLAALLLLGETPWLQSWNRGRERVCVSPCFYPDGTGQPSFTQQAH